MRVRRYKLDEAVYDSLYSHEGELGDPCVYCGVESCGWDHVPPLHYVGRLSDEDRKRSRPRKLPSCEECNKVLGGVVLTSLHDRRAWVKRQLRRRYAHQLRIPEWREDELAELTGRTREDVQTYSAFAQHLMQRLNYYG